MNKSLDLVTSLRKNAPGHVLDPLHVHLFGGLGVTDLQGGLVYHPWSLNQVLAGIVSLI